MCTNSDLALILSTVAGGVQLGPVMEVRMEEPQEKLVRETGVGEVLQEEVVAPKTQAVMGDLFVVQ